MSGRTDRRGERGELGGYSGSSKPSCYLGMAWSDRLSRLIRGPGCLHDLANGAEAALWLSIVHDLYGASVAGPEEDLLARPDSPIAGIKRALEDLLVVDDHLEPDPTAEASLDVYCLQGGWRW